MQQENKVMQKELALAQELIKLQEKQINALLLSAEVNRERIEMFEEILRYYVPKFKIGHVWERVYLPVYGKIKSPPFSKN
ncbi:hypothetical protein [Flavobacterium macrobrachii]|uniref:Uncharacterized protein n=1 Tax=Flavobacterium macrobrachii TaxID=591204 RepID=A0ABS2CXQ4_9FLAO|nr:hypothetical protein [Flavobacterium macrobrachii]MBM6498987.1 hypothetical protein [Flavobacterium macrobrachii]